MIRQLEQEAPELSACRIGRYVPVSRSSAAVGVRRIDWPWMARTALGEVPLRSGRVRSGVARGHGWAGRHHLGEACAGPGRLETQQSCPLAGMEGQPRGKRLASMIRSGGGEGVAAPDSP